jgi:hypothetical protein
VSIAAAGGCWDSSAESRGFLLCCCDCDAELSHAIVQAFLVFAQLEHGSDGINTPAPATKPSGIAISHALFPFLH